MSYRVINRNRSSRTTSTLAKDARLIFQRGKIRIYDRSSLSKQDDVGQVFSITVQTLAGEVVAKDLLVVRNAYMPTTCKLVTQTDIGLFTRVAYKVVKGVPRTKRRHKTCCKSIDTEDDEDEEDESEGSGIESESVEDEVGKSDDDCNNDSSSGSSEDDNLRSSDGSDNSECGSGDKEESQEEDGAEDEEESDIDSSSDTVTESGSGSEESDADEESDEDDESESVLDDDYLSADEDSGVRNHNFYD